MKYLFLLLVTVCLLNTSQAQTVLLETFGSSNGYSVVDPYYVSFTSSGSGVGVRKGAGVKFTTPAGSNITSFTIDVAVRVQKDILFYITTNDAHDLPDEAVVAPVGSIEVTGSTPFQGVQTFTQSSINLSPSTTYWLIGVTELEEDSPVSSWYRTNSSSATATVASYSQSESCPTCKPNHGAIPWQISSSGNVLAVRITTGIVAGLSSSYESNWACAWFSGDELNIFCEEDHFYTSVYSVSGQKLIESENDKNITTQLIAGSYIIEIIAQDHVYRRLVVK